MTIQKIYRLAARCAIKSASSCEVFSTGALVCHQVRHPDSLTPLVVLIFLSLLSLLGEAMSDKCVRKTFEACSKKDDYNA